MYVVLSIGRHRSLYHLETLWFKDEQPIEHSGVGHTFNDLWNRTLSLLNVDASHSGRYSCKVSSKSQRSDPITAGANVTILGMCLCVQPNNQRPLLLGCVCVYRLRLSFIYYPRAIDVFLCKEIAQL